MGTVVTAAVESQQALETTLEEFCSNLSRTDRRVEMIGAFYATEKKAGRTKATAESFTEAYAAFVTKPA